MEDNRPPVNEDEASFSAKEKTTDSKKKRRSLFEPLQARWQEIFADKSEDKDRLQPEDDPQTSRFRAFWSKLLGNVVTTEDQPLTPESSDKLESTNADVTNLEASEYQPTDYESISWSLPNASVEGETKIDHNRPPKTSEPRPQRTKPFKPSTAEDSVVEVSLTNSDQQTERLPEPTETPELIPQPLHYEDLAQATPIEVAQPTLETAPEDPQDSKKIEKKLDDQTRKLKRELRRREERLKAFIKQREITNERQLSLQPELPNLQPEHHALKVAPIERKPLSHIETVVEREARLQQPQILIEQPSPSILRPEALSAAKPAEVNLEPTVEQPAVEKVLERVVAAAEHDEPIEKRYEQRHEVKDSDLLRRPVPVGRVVSDALNRYGKEARRSTLTSTESLQRTLAKQQAVRNQKDFYASAMRWGFWSAVTLIVLGLLAFIVLR